MIILIFPNAATAAAAGIGAVADAAAAAAVDDAAAVTPITAEPFGPPCREFAWFCHVPLS